MGLGPLQPDLCMALICMAFADNSRPQPGHFFITAGRPTFAIMQIVQTTIARVNGEILYLETGLYESCYSVTEMPTDTPAITDLLNGSPAAGLEVEAGKKYVIFVDPVCVNLDDARLADTDITLIPFLTTPGRSLRECLFMLPEVREIVQAERERCLEIAKQEYSTYAPESVSGKYEEGFTAACERIIANIGGGE